MPHNRRVLSQSRFIRFVARFALLRFSSYRIYNILNLFVSFSLPVLDKSFEEQIFEVNCRMKVIEGGNRELI